MVRKPNKPFIVCIKRGDKSYWYFRRGKTLIRLPDDPDSPEFEKAF